MLVKATLYMETLLGPLTPSIPLAFSEQSYEWHPSEPSRSKQIF